MIKLDIKHDRSKLGEGRNYGMGFGFLRKIEEDHFETVMPISTCKDYLNDQVWSEHTGKECAAFGFNAKQENIFQEDFGYMAIEICPHTNGIPYPQQEEHTKNLESNYRNLQRFMRTIDKMFKLPARTTIKKCDKKGIYIVYAPAYWTKFPYLTSLFAFMLRLGQFYTEGNIVEYLRTFNKFQVDVYNCRTALNKLLLLAHIEPPKYEFDKYSGTVVHNLGIVGFQI